MGLHSFQFDSDRPPQLQDANISKREKQEDVGTDIKYKISL